MPKKDHSYVPAEYDKEAVDALLSQEDFKEAFVGALRLLGVAFVLNPKEPDHKDALNTLNNIDLAADWPFGARDECARAQELFAQGAAEEDEAALVREYTRLFRGPGHLPAPPWGSVYMDRDQVMYGWTWVELRAWMQAHGFTGTYDENDPEDQFGRLLLLACEIIQQKPELLAEFLGNHLLCWAPRFLEYFEEATRSHTYKACAVLAQTTLDDISHLFGIVAAKKPLFYTMYE